MLLFNRKQCNHDHVDTRLCEFVVGLAAFFETPELKRIKIDDYVLALHNSYAMSA